MRLSHLIIYFALAAATADYGTFQAFKLKFGKSYDAPLAESRAQECWKENMEMIRRYQSNSSTSSLELGENIYSDQCWEDFSSARLMPKPYGLQGTCWKSPITEYTKTCNLSQAIDWRKEGAVTPVKNQASCGSCWSFSATGCMEGAWFRKTGKLASFSEQELVSCDTSGDDHGCKGGGPDTAFQWAINNGGIATEEDYPYTGKDDACDSGKESKKVGQFGSFQCLDRHNETLVLAALQNEGPMSIVVQATQVWQQCKGGIATQKACGTTRVSLLREHD